ncbi:MAG: LytR/AlgR family response regulator transcription factor, partial [Armatimonadota bacterium]
MTRPAFLSAAIADDEPAARWHLRGLLEACRVHTVAACATGHDALAAIVNSRPDMVCLDIRMPDGDGIEVARALDTRARPAVVFTTGYVEYAPVAFDLDAADYLLKPLTLARVTEAIRRVRLRLRHAERAATAAAESTVATDTPLRIFVPAGDHHQALAPEAIRFIEARGGVCVLHADDRSYPVRIPLARLERALAACGFLRTHRAYLVNLRRVRALVTWSRHAHTLLLDAGKETHVPVAKS